MKLRLVLAALFAATTARAQDVRPPVPQILTSAQGEVRVTPDRATVMVGVQTRAATAADAAAQNSRKQRAVIDAIKARGVPAEQIGTSGFSVVPETRYDKDQTPHTTGYLVNNVVTVDLRRIDLVGPVIDASLGAGANQINSLQFGVSNADSARRAALTAAVQKARADAEAIARAAGGSLGELIELSASDMYSPPPRPMAMVMRTVAAGQASDVPVEAGEETIRAGVTARWQFRSAPR
jgi:uncharacterized protein YggE